MGIQDRFWPSRSVTSGSDQQGSSRWLDLCFDCESERYMGLCSDEAPQEVTMTQRPNHTLQRTRPSHHCCNPASSRAGSLSLGRSPHLEIAQRLIDGQRHQVGITSSARLTDLRITQLMRKSVSTCCHCPTAKSKLGRRGPKGENQSLERMLARQDARFARQRLGRHRSTLSLGGITRMEISGIVDRRGQCDVHCTLACFLQASI